MPTPLRLARLAGGVTYQPQFTFQERRLAIADELQAELLHSSPSGTWPPRGFSVGLADKDKVSVSHLRHEGWRALISEADIYFQYDYPPLDNLDEALRVQTELYARVMTRLAVEPVRSIGIKFISTHRTRDVDELAQIVPRLVLFPGTPSSPLSVTPLDVMVRVSYPVFDGTAAASLQMAVDAETNTFILDLDCACRDAFGIPSDHLDFYGRCRDHFLGVSDAVQLEVLGRSSPQLESG